MRERAKKQMRIQAAMELNQTVELSPWLSLNSKEMSGVFKAHPELEDLPAVFKVNLVVELYRSRGDAMTETQKIKQYPVYNDMLIPNKVKIDELSSNNYKITLEPFERGYGYTLGAALRRIIIFHAWRCPC